MDENGSELDVRAGWLVWMRLCEGSCLVAARSECTCICGGRYHGILYNQLIKTDLSDHADWELDRWEYGYEKLLEAGLAYYKSKGAEITPNG